MQLKPSEIRYSQSSIYYRFAKGSPTFGSTLSETLKKILDRDISIRNLPTISVAKHNANWMVSDGNRRLFIFKVMYYIL